MRVRIVRRGLSRCVLVTVAATLVAPAVAGFQNATFRTTTELVLLPVTARDAKGRAVRDLAKADFRIFENGRPQSVEVFSPDTMPTALSLLLDTSASMEPNLSSAQSAASAIVDRLGPGDVGQVIAFNSTVDVRQDFTGDQTLLRNAIGSLRASGATALYNAIYIALRGLQRTRAVASSDLRREAIILLSDGFDTSSLLEFDQVLDAAQRAQTLIYTIALELGTEATQRRGRDGLYVLRHLADQTGGRSYTVTNIRDLDQVYGQIYEAIAASYMLGYIPASEAPGRGWRVVSVAVNRPGVSVRTRAGYFRQ